MKKFFLFLAAVEVGLGFATSSLSAEGVKPLIIDVRTEAEWNNGHIEGAILIPYELIGEKIGTVVKDKSSRIYIYCRTGRRSQIAKKALEKIGYGNIVDLGSLENAARNMKRRIVK
ncbi:MAG: rhodanese-like domain-containing protein [Syntrophales bacterium]